MQLWLEFIVWGLFTSLFFASLPTRLVAPSPWFGYLGQVYGNRSRSAAGFLPTLAPAATSAFSSGEEADSFFAPSSCAGGGAVRAWG